jgi:hypothetical protein
VTASGGAATVLKVAGNFNVTGPLETFANAGGVHLARAILAEFAGNMARLAAERPALTPVAEPESAAAPHPPADAGPSLSPPGGGSAGARGAATELRGGVILWRAFLGWLKQLFFAKGKTG